MPLRLPAGFIFTGHGWLVIVHGFGLGVPFVAVLALTFVALHTGRPELLTPLGLAHRLRTLRRCALAGVALGWATVVVGAFFVDPLFHGGNDPPAHILESFSGTVRWVTWAMPGKENLALMAAILTTVVAIALLTQPERLVVAGRPRRLMMTFLGLALVFAALAGLLGSGLAKVGPIV